MRPRWDRIVGFGMLLFGFWLLGHFSGHFVWLVSRLGDITAPHGRPEDRTFGLVVAGLLFVFVLAAIKLLSRRDSSDR